MLTSSSSALSSPSVRPFDPLAAGSLLIMPSTSFTILSAASAEVAPGEETVRTDSDKGCVVAPGSSPGEVVVMVCVTPLLSGGVCGDKSSRGWMVCYRDEGNAGRWRVSFRA